MQKPHYEEQINKGGNMAKKKILFDFITLQDNYINGGMLYTQKILYEILNNEVIMYGLYDGNLLINEKTKTIVEKYKITLLNIREEKIFETINGLQIDTFFIGIAQRYNFFDLCDLKCKVIVVCHDLGDKSLEYFKIPQSEHLKIFAEKYLIKQKKIKRKENKVKFIVKIILYPLVLLRRGILLLMYYTKQRNIVYYANFVKLIQLPNVFVVTVSEYSKYNIQYFLGSPKNGINVFYSPINNEFFEEKECISKIGIEGKKYFLLISVDRQFKNVILFLEQWEKFCLATNNEYYCVLVGEIKANIKNGIILEEVSFGELAYLYKNAFAFVYPSFTEGFGYPPIEAAMYATPSICANVTSIPEICGDMPIYFSPFYPEDLFRAMIEMTMNRDIYVEKAKKRFLEINKRQKEDLQKLMDFILN